MGASRVSLARKDRLAPTAPCALGTALEGWETYLRTAERVPQPARGAPPFAWGQATAHLFGTGPRASPAPCCSRQLPLIPDTAASSNAARDLRLPQARRSISVRVRETTPSPGHADRVAFHLEAGHHTYPGVFPQGRVAGAVIHRPRCCRLTGRRRSPGSAVWIQHRHNPPVPLTQASRCAMTDSSATWASRDKLLRSYYDNQSGACRSTAGGRLQGASCWRDLGWPLWLVTAQNARLFREARGVFIPDRVPAFATDDVDRA